MEPFTAPRIPAMDEDAPFSREAASRGISDTSGKGTVMTPVDEIGQNDGKNEQNRDPSRALTLALHEIACLEEIIARHEKHAFAVKAFLAAVITGLATMAFSLSFHVGPRVTLLMGVAAVIGFGCWAWLHKLLCGKAIRRVRDIENYLREPTLGRYDGPKISESLEASSSLSDKLEAAGHPTNSVPLTLAFAMVLFVGWAESQTTSMHKGETKQTVGSIERTKYVLGLTSDNVEISVRAREGECGVTIGRSIERDRGQGRLEK